MIQIDTTRQRTGSIGIGSRLITASSANEIWLSLFRSSVRTSTEERRAGSAWDAGVVAGARTARRRRAPRSSWRPLSACQQAAEAYTITFKARTALLSGIGEEQWTRSWMREHSCAPVPDH